MHLFRQSIVFTLVLFTSCSGDEGSTFTLASISGNKLSVAGISLDKVDQLSVHESGNESNRIAFTILEKNKDLIVASPSEDFEFEAGRTYSVAGSTQSSAVNIDVQITVTGLAKCAEGFTLVGRKGKGAFCISSSAESAQDYWSAVETCRGKDPSSQLCSPQEWYLACKDGSPNGLSPWSQRDNWDPVHPFDNAEKTGGLVSEGNSLLIINQDGECHTMAPGAISVANKFRCCYR